VNERMQRYVCAHCKARPPRGDYMVYDAVWAKAGMSPRGFLCLGCLEKRLVAAGHGPLQLYNFTNAPCNAGVYFGYAMASHAAAAMRSNSESSGSGPVQEPTQETAQAADQNTDKEYWPQQDHPQLLQQRQLRREHGDERREEYGAEQVADREEDHRHLPKIREKQTCGTAVKIIFLDIDGVLNHCDTRDPRIATDQEPLPIPIAPECMARLNRLIAETCAKIVISSSWRKFARWQDLGPALVRHGLIGDVIGETPDLVNDEGWLANWQVRTGAPFTYERLERGWEIREWLAAHPEVTAFVILDDCSDMDELKPWLVLTHPIDGLDDPDVERAKWLLERSADGLVVAREKAFGTSTTAEKQ
jgi:hypothetical protein